MSTTPIRQALSALSTHGELIEQLITGGAIEQEGIGKQAMLALRQANALRPAAEGNWRQHPRLREYLQDHQQLASPYPTMTDLGPRVRKLRAFLDEAHDAHAARDHESLQLLMEQMHTEVWDIAEMAERNLRVLGQLMNIRYGDVTSYKAKLAQNRWYQRRAGDLAEDFTRMRKDVELIERECEERRWTVARAVRRSLVDMLPRWTSQLSSIQSRLRQEQYRLHEVQQNSRNLARVDAFLTQNPGWPGLEVHLPEQIPDFLLHAGLSSIASHPDPHDDDRRMRHDLAELARSVPLRAQPRRAEPPARLKPVRDVGAPAPDQDVYLVTLRHFAQAVVQAGDKLSVLTWAATAPEAAPLRPPADTSIRPSVWLMFAASTLDGQDGRSHRVGRRSVCFEVRERPNSAGAEGSTSHTFFDAWVSVQSVQDIRSRDGRQPSQASSELTLHE